MKKVELNYTGKIIPRGPKGNWAISVPQNFIREFELKNCTVEVLLSGDFIFDIPIRYCAKVTTRNGQGYCAIKVPKQYMSDYFDIYNIDLRNQTVDVSLKFKPLYCIKKTEINLTPSKSQRLLKHEMF